jgi:predicted amidohydrolase
MDAHPAPTAARLARAEALVTAAVADGAQLVVLPELFNLGYAYSDDNFRRAEPLDGPTASWLQTTAGRLKVHLAGSLLLLDGGEIYNTLLLCAPDGRRWRYDKRYPWGWERAYFRPGEGITVAQTDLGAIGMLICWDLAHPELWQRYAGQVDLMLVSSCPPDAGRPVYHFPSGDRITAVQRGPLLRRLADAGSLTFETMLRQQAAWLGIPAVNAAGCGQVTTAVPSSLASFLLFLPLAPRMIRYLSQARRLQATYDFVPCCQIVAPNGQVLAALTQDQGESWTSAAVTLPAARPRPQGPQPPSPVPRPAYWISDRLLPALVTSTYRRGARRA